MEIQTFEELEQYVQQHSCEELLLVPLKNLGVHYSCDLEKLSSTDEMIAVLNETTKGKYTIILGNIVRDEILDIKNNFSKYQMFHKTMLADEKSKEVLFNILLFRLTRMNRYIAKAYCQDSEQYFDPQISIYIVNCVYVDCGALDGYNAAKFMLQCPNFSKIYLYEPMEIYYTDCVKNIEEFQDKRIITRQSAVFDKSTTLHFSANVAGSSKVDDKGSIAVQAVTLDEDIREPLGFIKMDIEGSEKNALRGAMNHIANDSPMLTISIYHLPTDLWQIPFMIQEMNGNYLYYIRHHQFCSDETVLYAVPKDPAQTTIPGEERLSAELECKCRRFVERIEERDLINLRVAQKYAIGQMENYLFLSRDLMDANAELKEWVQKLEEAKAYLLSEKQRLEMENVLLQKWETVLQERDGNLHLEQQIRDENLRLEQQKRDEKMQLELQNRDKVLASFLEMNKPLYRKLLQKLRSK